MDLQILRTLIIEALSAPNGKIKTKEIIRWLHEPQRIERTKAEIRMVSRYAGSLLPYFAEGSEVKPSSIKPKLIHVKKPESLEGRLFRTATLLWSVPVSNGYGRRMRYLVVDSHNDKLIGIFALGDPVFNLKCRDAWIGWNTQQRRDRLAFVFDAYVLGAVPPYSSILGGKLVASLLHSSEIQSKFRSRYAETTGIISKSLKNAHLVLITTTSALGRSSIYNRLRLPGLVELIKIGNTEGWGHFLISNELFDEIRDFLKAHGEAYANNYQFGEGPSWRLRALRKACALLDIDENLIRHGINREVYAMPLADNWRNILLGNLDVPNINECSNTDNLGQAALCRWVIPRAERDSNWKHWTRQELWRALTNYF